jgi:DNA polymerase-3 subunit epsilon
VSGRVAASWSQKLAQLTRGGVSLSASDLARRMLSLTAPIEESLARRLVAAAVGVSCERVPARIEPEAVPQLLHGPTANRPLERADFVVVDLETTGLSVVRATVLEIGAVRVAQRQGVESFHTLCDPQRAIPARITRLTGIDMHVVRGAPPLEQALRSFCTWLDRFSEAPFVAHNAAFDQRFIEGALAQHGFAPLGRPVLCTRKLARRLVPELGRLGLDSLCAHFGISNQARHRALGDAQATARALIELLELARTRAGLRTVGDLLDFQDRPPETSGAARRRQARWQPSGRV